MNKTNNYMWHLNVRLIINILEIMIRLMIKDNWLAIIQNNPLIMIPVKHKNLYIIKNTKSRWIM